MHIVPSTGCTCRLGRLVQGWRAWEKDKKTRDRLEPEQVAPTPSPGWLRGVDSDRSQRLVMQDGCETSVPPGSCCATPATPTAAHTPPLLLARLVRQVLSSSSSSSPSSCPWPICRHLYCPRFPTALRPVCVCYSYITAVTGLVPSARWASEQLCSCQATSTTAILSRPGIVGKRCGASSGRARRPVNRSGRRTVGTPGLRKKDEMSIGYKTWKMRLGLVGLHGRARCAERAR